MPRSKWGRFLTTLRVEEYGSDSWSLLEPLIYRPGAGTGFIKDITARAGFVTDLASIPRLFRFAISVNDRHRPAAVIHDWLYCYQKVGGRWIERAEADRVFYVAMRARGVGLIKARTMYAAVRMGGWLYFNRRARREGNPHYK